MPQKNREEYNAYQRQHRATSRNAEKMSVLEPPGKKETAAKSAPVKSSALAPKKTPRVKPSDAAKAEAERFTAELLGDMSKLTRAVWISKRAQLASEMMQIGMEAIRFNHGVLEDQKPKSFIKSSDALRMLKNGVTMMDQVVHTLAPDPEEGPDRNALAEAHRKVLATPEGREASQKLMMMRSQAYQELRGQKPK